MKARLEGGRFVCFIQSFCYLPPHYPGGERRGETAAGLIGDGPRSGIAFLKWPASQRAI